MANSNQNLKAWVRVNGAGQVVAGGPILQASRPKVGRWMQINITECCDGSCAVPVYEDNYIINDVIEDENGLTVYFSTAPDYVMQTALLACTEYGAPTQNVVGQIYTIPANSSNYGVFFPASELVNACTLGLRTQCSVNFYSQWIGTLGG